MTRRAHVFVDGRVQGVFYRAACAQAAVAAGLAGWVQNLPDGRVEAVFEGPAPAVEDLVAWCGKGPPGARVTVVAVSDQPPSGERGFAIRR